MGEKEKVSFLEESIIYESEGKAFEEINADNFGKIATASRSITIQSKDAFEEIRQTWSQLQEQFGEDSLRDEFNSFLSNVSSAVRSALNEKEEDLQFQKAKVENLLTTIEDLNGELDMQLDLEKERAKKEYEARERILLHTLREKLRQSTSAMEEFREENQVLRSQLSEIETRKNYLIAETEKLSQEKQEILSTLKSTLSELEKAKSNATTNNANDDEVDGSFSDGQYKELAFQLIEERDKLYCALQNLEDQNKKLLEEKVELEEFRAYCSNAIINAALDPENDNSNIDAEILKDIMEYEEKRRAEDEEFWTFDCMSSTTCTPTVCGTMTPRSIFSRRESETSSCTGAACSDEDMHHWIREDVQHSRDLLSETEAPTFSVDRMFKIILLGDSGVGKSTLIHRICHDEYIPAMSSTIGLDCTTRNIQVGSQMCALQLWDTCGQERFRTLTRAYFRGADGVILLYDVTKEKTFLNIRGWAAELNGKVEDAVLLLLGNKADLQCTNKKVVDACSVRGLLGDGGLEFDFAEVSAKTGYNIKEAMYSFVSHLLHNQNEQIRIAREDCSSCLRLNQPISKRKQRNTICCR